MKEPNVIYGKTYEQARKEKLVGDLIISEFEGTSEWNSFRTPKLSLAQKIDQAIEDCKSQILTEAEREGANWIFMHSIRYVVGGASDAAGPVWINAQLGKTR